MRAMTLRRPRRRLFCDPSAGEAPAGVVGAGEGREEAGRRAEVPDQPPTQKQKCERFWTLPVRVAGAR